MVAAYVLFFVAGLVFGYAAEGWAKFLPLLFPLALAVGAIAKGGVDGTVVLRLVIALVATAVGIVLGRVLDRRSCRREAAA